MEQIGLTPNIQHMPFDFSAVSGTVGSNIAINDNFQGRGDFLAREITTFNNAGYSGYDLYRLQFETLIDKQSLFSDPVGMGCIQTDAQLSWKLPSPWLLPIDYAVRATLINMTSAFGGSAANVTTQHCLIGEIVPPGSYQSERRPYGFTFYFNLGFGEDFTSGGNVTDTYNLYPSFRAGFPPLLWDFELCSIYLDSLNIRVGDSGSIARFQKIKIFDRTKNKDLFDVPVVSGNVCGGRIEQSLDAANLSDPTGLTVNDVMAYDLPQKVLFKRGTQLSVKISMCLLWAGTQSTIPDLNQPACLLLMGNRLNG